MTSKVASLSVAQRPHHLFLGAVQVISFATLTGLAAHVKIPLWFTPVPVTLQSLVVILSGALLGSKKGALSQVLLIVLGLTGFSVFSQPLPASAVLMGPTGGYILGFVLAALVAGLIKETIRPKAFLSAFVWYFLASLFVFVPGVVWLKILSQQTWEVSLNLGFWPFLLGDILKTAIVASTVSGLSRISRA